MNGPEFTRGFQQPKRALTVLTSASAVSYLRDFSTEESCRGHSIGQRCRASPWYRLYSLAYAPLLRCSTLLITPSPTSSSFNGQAFSMWGMTSVKRGTGCRIITPVAVMLVQRAQSIDSFMPIERARPRYPGNPFHLRTAPPKSLPCDARPSRASVVPDTRARTPMPPLFG